MLERIAREPVVSAMLTRVVAFAAMRWGVELTVDDVLTVIVALDVLLALVVRSQVSPAGKQKASAL